MHVVVMQVHAAALLQHGDDAAVASTAVNGVSSPHTFCHTAPKGWGLQADLPPFCAQGASGK